MSQNAWEADKMLDVYIHDYLVKRNLQATAKAFQAEGNVSTDPVAIDAPGGFLFEWWSVFWDIFIARTNEKHSDVAASYIETQLIKAREQQQQQHAPQQQQTHLPQQPQQQQLQMQQLILQRHAQQQHQQEQQQQQQQQQQRHQQQQRRKESAHLSTSTPNSAVAAADPPVRQNSAAASSLAAKMYEDRLKVPTQRDALDETSMKSRLSENIGQLLESNQASMLKSAAPSGQPSGQMFHGSAGGMSATLQQAQTRNQQIQGSAQDNKPEANTPLNLRSAGPDASLIGIPGTNQAGNNLTLKGWPLTGLEQLRSGFLQQKSFMQSPQPLHHLQFLTPQQQQQLLLQAQQNLTSTGEIDSRRLRMLFNSRNMALGRDGQSNSFSDIVPNVGPPMQNVCSLLPRTETDMLIKKIAQLQQQQQGSNQHQHLQQHPILSQQSQSSYPHLGQQEKLGAGSVTVDGSLSNSFRGNDQVSKNQNGRKRKQPISSSGPANSSGTANTAGPSPSSAPSTPSTHTPGDVISMPSLHHNASSSKPLAVFGSDGPGAMASPSNQLVDMDRFVEDGCLDDNVESFLSHDEADPRDAGSHCMDSAKGFTFNEFLSARASTNKVVCCHFSSDGKLLATGGHDKKAVLWYTDALKPKSTLEEHSLLITDVRFSPSVPRLATASFDKTIRVWDADNQGYSIRTFTGHSASVMSLDFHPNKDDLICSCDGDGEIRYWSITNGNIVRISKGGSTQLRFQSRAGRYLAAAAEKIVSILDVEAQTCIQTLEGHTKRVDSLCWDPSGEYVVSASEDSVKVWSVGSGNNGECIHELSCSGSKFHSCVFHPTYPSLLIIGCYQSLELWDMSENRTMTLPAHDGLISALAASNATGLVASASHDKFVKLWK